MGSERFVRDPVHSFISFEKNGIINQIVDTIEFQRLKYIRQLGLSYFTYPSATHTRFSHSLGTYWIANRLLKDLNEVFNQEYTSEFLIAAILHDIGHGPFSHVLENELINISHEELSKKIIESEDYHISKILLDNSIEPKSISKIITSGAMPSYLHYLLSSQIDVDRFDFLLRDSLFTGNPHGHFDIERILKSIKLDKETEKIYVSLGGLYAVEHYLICRYQMYKQVYYHHATLSAEELLKKILRRAKEVYPKEKIIILPEYIPLMEDKLNIQDYINLGDNDIQILIKIFSKSSDKILSDLCERFIQRRLFKSIKIKNIEILIDKMDKIKKLIEIKGYDTNYYFSYVTHSKKSVYKPYSPSPRDQEESIFLDPNWEKEISTEIESLKYISTPIEVYLFMPEECKSDIQKIL